GVSEKVMALINFHANWSSPKAYSHLHGWVKIPLPSTGNLDHLSGIQFSTNSGNYTAFLGYNGPAADLANNAWRPVDLALTPAANYMPGDVDQIGVQLIAKSSAPAGSAAPVPTSIFVDDIWLE